jgi:hypothetical protein
MDWNWLRHNRFCIYPEEINLSGEKLNSKNKNTEALLLASNKVHLEVNAEKTKYIFMFHEQNAGQSHNINTGNKFSENVAKLKYLAIILRN